MTLVYLAIAWMGGIWLAHQLWMLGLLGCETSPLPFGVTAAAAAALAIVLHRQPKARLAAVLVALFVLGGWRYQEHPFAACTTPGDLAFYNGSDKHTAQATVEGVIVGYPDVRDTYTAYRLRAERLTIGAETHEVRGDVLVQAPRSPNTPTATASAHRVSSKPRRSSMISTIEAYLNARGIYSLLHRSRIELIAHDKGCPFWVVLYGLRARGSALLSRVLPEPAAALANGMVLGIESGIPAAVDEAFKATGTTHVIVISGSNISVLMGVLMGLLARLLGKRWAAVPTAAAVVVYVLLVGADPAAFRAGVMGAMYVFAIALGRASTAFVSLFFAALIMTLVNPLMLWDTGFQLSFAATLGMILFTPPIQARFERFFVRFLAQERARQAMGFLNDTLIVTLAAQVLTLPLAIFYFGRLPLVSLVANFLILPAQPPIMLGGMLTLVTGLVSEPLGRIAAVVPWLFLTYTVSIVKALASVPLASVDAGAAGKALAVLCCAGLAIALIHRNWAPARRILPAPRRAVAWAAAAVVPAWLMITVIGLLPDGRLHLAFIPGQGGEAALVTMPGGRTAWIWDGRGDGDALAAATRPLLQGWRPGVAAAIGPGAAGYWPDAREIDPAATPPGATVQLGDGVELLRLPAEEGWLLRYRDFSTLLPSTIQPAAQAGLLREASGDLHVTLLKAPGSGTAAWPTTPFLQALAPQMILWPQGTTYPPDVVEMLEQWGALRAQRVPDAAVVEALTDGERVWLRQWSLSGKR